MLRGFSYSYKRSIKYWLGIGEIGIKFEDFLAVKMNKIELQHEKLYEILA
jgi:hypothetical protein